jgi:hypothetical protein
VTKKSHTIEDLRTHLFETLEQLKNKDAPMEIDRARAITEVAHAVISSAKVEVEYLKLTDQTESEFLAQPKESPKLPPGITGVTVHRLK